MKNKLVFGLTLLASSAASFATSVIVTNSRGPAATQEVVKADGTLVAGFGGFGILNEAGISGVNTTFAGLSFQQYGNGGGAVSTSTSGQFSFTDNLNIGTTGSAFASKNVYLLVGFGGTNLATSTQLFAYKFNDTFGATDSPTPITLTLSSSPGSVLLGTNNSSRFQAVALTVVPEASTALLGAIGALGLLRRRRN